MAGGIWHIPLGLYPYQEQFLLLAHFVRNPPAENAAQSQASFGISLSPGAELTFGGRILALTSWKCLGENMRPRKS